MSINALMSEIETLTKKEIEDIMKEAEAKAEEIVRKARKTAEEIRSKKIREKEEEMSEKMAARLAMAKLEGRKKILEIKSRLLDEVVKRAERRLREIVEEKEGRYSEILRKLIVEAALNVDSDRLVVLASKGDKKIISKFIRDVEKEISRLGRNGVRIRVSNDELSAIGGVVVQSEDGRQMFNNTFEARLIKFREELKGELLEILFGE